MEVRRKCKMFARKHHPDKWSKKCEFSKELGESMFKGMANTAYKMMMRR